MSRVLREDRSETSGDRPKTCWTKSRPGTVAKGQVGHVPSLSLLGGEPVLTKSEIFCEF